MGISVQSTARATACSSLLPTHPKACCGARCSKVIHRQPKCSEGRPSEHHHLSHSPPQLSISSAVSCTGFLRMKPQSYYIWNLCSVSLKSFHMLQEMLPKQVLMHTRAVSGMGPGMQLFFWLLIFFFFCDIPFFTLLLVFFLFPSLPSLSNQPHRTGHQKQSPLDNLHVSWWNNSTYLGASQIRNMVFPQRATNNTHLPKTAFSQYTKEG